jgi:6-phosphogluconolactonase (cycloisomerase 2 family)
METIVNVNEVIKIDENSDGPPSFENPGYAVFNEVNNLLVIRDISTENGYINIFKYDPIENTFTLLKTMTAGFDKQNDSDQTRTSPLAISDNFIICSNPYHNFRTGTVVIIRLDENGVPIIQGNGTNIIDSGNTDIFRIGSSPGDDINIGSSRERYLGEMVGITKDSQWLFVGERIQNNAPENGTGNLFIFRKNGDFSWEPYQEIVGESANYQGFSHMNIQENNVLTLLASNLNSSEIKVYILDENDTSVDTSGTFVQLGEDAKNLKVVILLIMLILDIIHI